MFGGCGEKGWSRKTSEKGGFLKEEEKFPKQTEGGQGSENSTCEGMAVTVSMGMTAFCQVWRRVYKGAWLLITARLVDVH